MGGLLLTASEGIDENVFFERVTRMFGGHDTPDPELVRAISTAIMIVVQQIILRPQDNLSARHVEHGELVGLLVD
jgi:hypothetical protein